MDARTPTLPGACRFTACRPGRAPVFTRPRTTATRVPPLREQLGERERLGVGDSGRLSAAESEGR